MKYIILVLTTLCIWLSACDDMSVGYLSVEYAKYSPDSLVVDPNTASEERIANKIPWVSVNIDGIDGTQPIQLFVDRVVYFSDENSSSSGKNFDVELFGKDVNLRGDGVFDVAFKNSLSPGKYVISIKVQNEGHKAYLKDVFNIIVKGKEE